MDEGAWCELPGGAAVGAGAGGGGEGVKEEPGPLRASPFL